LKPERHDERNKRAESAARNASGAHEHRSLHGKECEMTGPKLLGTQAGKSMAAKGGR
jgi:hypothetical protein